MAKGKIISIDLHGYTTAEAVEELEITIDRALQKNIDYIEIIHGIGTGKVKKAVTSYLKASKHIKAFKIAEGNPGTTFAYL